MLQVKDNLGILAERWKAVKLEGGAGLRLSRMAGRWRKPLALRKITQVLACLVSCMHADTRLTQLAAC